ncbi:reverse transcriptase [Gossypium australe]|uniref:Reverse transcriptase n=1 Tax=Gossypium australe TaxID=47621 RepID=A0A5B6UK20_9ROSI|nr:reverse transcriptase [Gossypium australe]
MEAFRSALEECRLIDVGYSGLGNWAKRICMARKRNKEFLNSKLGELLEAERNDNNLAELIDTKLQLTLEIDKDKRYWEQRARVNWLRLGDKNTSFFHNHATQRRQQNRIRSLQNRTGEETEDMHEMAEIARNYFQELFDVKKRGSCTNLLTGIQQCINEEDNRYLTAQYTVEEIWEALQSMGATKAPGEDEFPALFFHKCWHIIGAEVSSFCLQHLNGVMEVSLVNNTHIVLIPKKANPTSLSHFRPISLCNVIYKIMAKTIANRFRSVLEKCIDKAQSTFVPGRLISDNVLLAYEILHMLKRKKFGKKGWMAVKLDMSKAYDRVEWSCLKEIMGKMGFDQNWISSIINYISTVSYSVILNGQIGDTFHPSRGLRQGGPLSPFLFLICGEGLSSLMRNVTNEGLLKGVKASRRGPQISHLLFADDCILFGEANERGAERYLGLPNMVGRRKKEAFQNLKDRFKQRIDNWCIRHLSQGGKEVFIKAVPQAIPTYTMAYFLLPKSLCAELESIIVKFWWQKRRGKRGIHWCAWKDLCIAKEQGGLGFRNINQCDVAMLAKQGWRLINYPNSLLAQVLKVKYYPHSDFIHAQLGNLPSLTWKSVWAAKGLLQDGLGWRIGRGDQVSVWNDRWIPGVDSIQSRNFNDSTEIKLVSSLIDSTTRKWKVGLIEHTFPESIAQKILQIPLAEEIHEDFQVWYGEHSGEFTQKKIVPTSLDSAL